MKRTYPFWDIFCLLLNEWVTHHLTLILILFVHSIQHTNTQIPNQNYILYVNVSGGKTIRTSWVRLPSRDKLWTTRTTIYTLVARSFDWRPTIALATRLTLLFVISLTHSLTQTQFFCEHGIRVVHHTILLCSNNWEIESALNINKASSRHFSLLLFIYWEWR